MNLNGPTNDDELHQWIKLNLGLDIPRVAVCEGHASPFEFIADMYFERELSAVAMANRGGSKTYGVAILHLLNSKFKPGCDSATVGAIEKQALRCYEHLQKLLMQDGKCDSPEHHPEVSLSIMRETKFKNHSRVEILPGTVSSVNGPHPQKVHFDEVELADPQVFQESRNMSQSKGGIKAQDIITSTRKRAHGQMQEIIDEIELAERDGRKPPYKLYTWCIFETAQRVDNCGNGCGCDQIVKGTWENGTPRKFSDICQGRLARSNGWIPLHDVHKTFTQVSQSIWEAQQECSKPSTEGSVIPNFERTRHCIRWWEPDPALGPIYMSIDFGGTNPHAVNWYQVLKYDVDAHGYNQAKSEKPKKRLKEGTRVCFDEIYKAEVGNTVIADMIVAREKYWKRRYPSFRVANRFADVQAKAARLDFARHDPPLPTSCFITRDVKEHIKVVAELVSDDLFVVDASRCPLFVEEVEAWHYPNKKAGLVDDPEKPVEDFDHCMSNWRYAMMSIHTLEKRNAIVRPGRTPTADSYIHETAKRMHRVTGTGHSRYAPRIEP